MLLDKERYEKFVEDKGVGSNAVAGGDSIGSYVSYLGSVSSIIGKNISPLNLSTENDVLRIAEQIKPSLGLLKQLKTINQQ